MVSFPFVSVGKLSSLRVPADRGILTDRDKAIPEMTEVVPLVSGVTIAASAMYGELA